MTPPLQRRPVARRQLAFARYLCGGALLLVLLAISALVCGQGSAAPASGDGSIYNYDGARQLSSVTRVSASVTMLAKATGSRRSTAGYARQHSEAVTRFAAEGASSTSLSIGEKIAGQMGSRGGTESLMQDTVDNPAATHDVWDFTSGTRQAATAYARSDGSYVVVNDETGTVVQVSDINKVGWKPVWDDPRFER